MKRHRPILVDANRPISVCECGEVYLTSQLTEGCPTCTRLNNEKDIDILLEIGAGRVKRTDEEKTTRRRAQYRAAKLRARIRQRRRAA